MLVIVALLSFRKTVGVLRVQRCVHGSKCVLVLPMSQFEMMSVGSTAAVIAMEVPALSFRWPMSGCMHCANMSTRYAKCLKACSASVQIAGHSRKLVARTQKV